MVEAGQHALQFSGGLALFFALAIGHALADFPLQGEFVALNKNRHYRPEHGGTLGRGGWVYCMLAHCLIHAGAVWLIMGEVKFALVEFLLHFILDMLKCEGRLSFQWDQFLHFACKAGYVMVWHQGWLA